MNKNLLIGIGAAVLILLAVFFVFRGRDTVIRNYPPKEGSIIAFGDSLTAGTGATEGNDFVSILSKKIGEPIENLGIPGNTTADALLRVDDAVQKNPRIVILLLGGNDFLRRVPRDNTFTNLKNIIAKFQNSDAIVVLLGVRTGLIFDGSAANFEDLARDTGSAYVPDVLDGLFGYPKYMSDEIHPNDAGYAIIAGKVYPVLRKILR